jgi:hypothetical protein
MAKSGVGPKLRYRLLTGPDDRAFCERVSAALDDGYELYGAPSVTFNGSQVIAAQAVVLKGAGQRAGGTGPSRQKHPALRREQA